MLRNPAADLLPVRQLRRSSHFLSVALLATDYLLVTMGLGVSTRPIPIPAFHAYTRQLSALRKLVSALAPAAGKLQHEQACSQNSLLRACPTTAPLLAPPAPLPPCAAHLVCWLHSRSLHVAAGLAHLRRAWQAQAHDRGRGSCSCNPSGHHLWPLDRLPGGLLLV